MDDPSRNCDITSLAALVPSSLVWYVGLSLEVQKRESATRWCCGRKSKLGIGSVCMYVTGSLNMANDCKARHLMGWYERMKEKVEWVRENGMLNNAILPALFYVDQANKWMSLDRWVWMCKSKSVWLVENGEKSDRGKLLLLRCYFFTTSSSSSVLISLLKRDGSVYGYVLHKWRRMGIRWMKQSGGN